MADENKAVLLKQLSKELMKTRYFYDTDGRNTFIAQARAGADDGDPCLVTRYTFDGTDTVPQASLEYEGTWDSSWDIAEATPADG